MFVDILTMSDLIVFSWDVALFNEVLRSDLSNVHVNQVSVMTVDFHHLILVVTIHVNIVIWRDMLMRKNNLWLSVLVSWSIHVCKMHVASFFLLINLKEEIFFGDHLIVGALSKFFSRNLIFKFNEANLLLDDFIDSLSDLR